MRIIILLIGGILGWSRIAVKVMVCAVLTVFVVIMKKLGGIADESVAKGFKRSVMVD